MKYKALPILLAFVMIFMTSCVIDQYDQPCQIYGKITDTSGQALEGVKVKISMQNQIDSILTGDDGMYKIDIESAGHVQISIGKDEFTSWEKETAILGGQKLNLSIYLRSRNEDGYFSTMLADQTVLNTGGIFLLGLVTNLSYEVLTEQNWISWNKQNNDIIFKCDSNETSIARTGSVIIIAEFGFRDTINFNQLAGPTLKILDYTGKTGSVQSQNIPFILFNQPIDLISVKHSETSINYTLSNDKNTLYFNDLILLNGQSYEVNVLVKDKDSISHRFILNLTK